MRGWDARKTPTFAIYAKRLSRIRNGRFTFKPSINGRVHIQTTLTATGIQIRFTDSGAGIAQEHLPFVFDRLYRTDQSRSRNTGGAGLGLAIVKAIVEAHNDRVRVSSQSIGYGTQLTISLPTSQI